MELFLWTIAKIDFLFHEDPEKMENNRSFVFVPFFCRVLSIYLKATESYYQTPERKVGNQ